MAQVQLFTEDDFYDFVYEMSKKSQPSKGGEDTKTHSVMILIATNKLSDATSADVDYVRKLVKAVFVIGKFGGDPKAWARWKESFLTALSTAGFDAMYQDGFVIPQRGTYGWSVYESINKWIFAALDTAITRNGGLARSLLDDYRTDTITGLFVLDSVSAFHALCTMYERPSDY